MITKKSEENVNNIHLLQKKRENSKKRKKGQKKHLRRKKHKESLSYSYKRKRDMKLTKENIRHFFHINWDDKIYDKETSKIGLYINGLIYWFLINSSYFVEENIPDYIIKLKEEINNSDILSNHNINNINNITKIANNNNEIMTPLISDTYNTENFMKNTTTYESHYKENNSINEIEYEYDYQNNNSNALKEKIFKHLNLIHQINENHIHELEKKADIIKKEFDNNNTIFDDSIKCINENPIYTKNELSFSILNKYLNYLFDKERNDLMGKERAQAKEKEYKFMSEISTNQNEEEEEESEDICFVCNNCDLNQYLSLYECYQCGIKVHQFCYGINSIKNLKHWKCDKCKEMSKEEGNNLECILCPNKGGAMKKINIPKDSSFYIYLMNCRNKKDFVDTNNSNYNIIIPKNKFKEIDCAWVHLSCAIWNNNFINIGNYDSKKNININNYENFNNLCNICNKNNYGPIVKCNNSNCEFQCHPECARLNNYYLEVEYIDVKKIYKYNIYCHNHHPNKYAKIINNITKYSNEEIYEFEDVLNKVFKIHKDYCKQQKSNTKIDMTEHEVIEIPISIKENDKIENKINKKNRKEKASICKIFIKKKRPKKEINNKYSLDKNCKSNNINRNIIFEGKNKENENILLRKTNKNQFVINLEEIEDSSENDIKSNSLENEKTPVILINNNSPLNNTNEAIKSKDINVQRLSLEQEIEQNKDSFIKHLIKYLYNYYDNNRIVLIKGNGDYCLPNDDESNPRNLIYYMEYEDLLDSNIPLSEMQFKDLSRESIKKYLEKIFPDEEAFNKLFINKIDSVLSESLNVEFNKDKEKDFT
jgi:hypothetical protein